MLLQSREKSVSVKDGYNALIFDNSLYTQDDIIITPFTPCYVCICATFSVEGENDQIIVTDFDPENPNIQFRGISVKFGDYRSLFYINGAEVQGVFSSQGTPSIEKARISISGRFDGSRVVSAHWKYMLVVKVDCPML